MEQKDKVSIWLTAFASAGELDDFVRESFTGAGDQRSAFTEAFAIDFIDRQFCEVLFAGVRLRAALDSLSYAPSFAQRIEIADVATGVIALYNFNYTGELTNSGRAWFAGVFDYRRG